MKIKFKPQIKTEYNQLLKKKTQKGFESLKLYYGNEIYIEKSRRGKIG